MSVQRHRFVSWAWVVLGASLLAAACAAPQKITKADPRALLRQGRYIEARQALIESEKPRKTPVGQALIAITLVAERPDAMGRDLAKIVLKNALPIDTPGEVFLKLGEEAGSQPAMADLLAATFMVEAALGAVGLEPGQPAAVNETLPLATRHQIGTRLLFILADASTAHSGIFPIDRVHALWKTTLGLLMEGARSLEYPADPKFAFDTYLALGTLAEAIGSTATMSDKVVEMLSMAVLIVESNPAIRVSVECDLRSPVDNLRKALAYERPLLQRLERALANVKGCRRGTYEPK